VAGKFAASAWGKKLAARQAKANQSDFERYQAAVAKAKRSRAVRKAYNQLAKSA
jgi:large subunit ribosomal protein L14e